MWNTSKVPLKFHLTSSYQTNNTSSPSFNPPTGTTDGAIYGEFAIFEPLTEGLHQFELRWIQNGENKSLSIPINVFVPEVVALATGETYQQDFNSLGTDGTEVKAALPSACSK